MNVTWTESAANQAKVILAGEGDDKLNVRCFIQGGGCSGFQYNIELDTKHEDDLILEKEGNKVFIDSTSLPFLSDAIIDFSDELIGARFVIENPNASSSCGCGTSFSI